MVQSLINAAMNNPQAAGTGLAAGFAIGYAIAWKKYRRRGMMGGGGF